MDGPSQASHPGTAGSVRFPDSNNNNNAIAGDSERDFGFSRGTDRGGDGSIATGGTDTVRFKEKRKMKYPWMKDVYKEIVTTEDKIDIGDVKALEQFKPPKGMRFY